MDNTFELKKGKLVFEADKILISDDVKYQRRMRLISAIFLVGLGIFNIYNYIRTNDEHLLRSGILVGTIGLFFVINAFLVNVQSEIALTDVKSMKLRKIFFREFLVIKLNNGRPRQVAGIYNAERLEEYIKTIPLSNSQL